MIKNPDTNVSGFLLYCNMDKVTIASEHFTLNGLIHVANWLL